MSPHFCKVGYTNDNPEIFVGIDISKDTLDIGFQPPGQTVELPHDEQGISEATRRLREAEPRLVVLEATGGLEMELAASLMAAGLAVVVVNPRPSSTLLLTKKDV